MNAETREWSPSVDVEQAWKDFLVGVMAHTVRMCTWLADKHAKRRIVIGKSGPSRQLRNAAAAWRWVFWGPESEITLEEACLHLGLTAAKVRAKILAESGAHGDINQVVAQVLYVAEVEYAEHCGETARSGGVVAVDWAGLRRYRSVYPVGSSIEDFCRVALGRQKDRHANRRQSRRPARGRA